MDAQDRVRRELSTALASVAAKLGVPHVEIARSQSSQRRRAEAREDVTIEQASVVLGDDGGEVRLGLCVPTLAEVADGASLRDDEPVVDLCHEASQLTRLPRASCPVQCG